MSDEAPPQRMTSHRPYLLRALNQWIADNGMTPHLLVDATLPGVQVPPQAVHEGKVVLNIADRAVTRLSIDNEWIGFTARFGGVSQPDAVRLGQDRDGGCVDRAHLVGDVRQLAFEDGAA